MTAKETIGKRIKELRQLRKLSQEALAEQVGISSQHLSSIERGKENPTLDTLLKISESMDFDYSELFIASHHMTDKELKALVIAFMKDSSRDRLQLAARVLKAIYQ